MSIFKAKYETVCVKVIDIECMRMQMNKISSCISHPYSFTWLISDGKLEQAVAYTPSLYISLLHWRNKDTRMGYNIQQLVDLPSLICERAQ